MFVCFFVQVDVDYQIESDFIAAQWGGFQDSQSGLSYYTVGVGTQPGMSDAYPFEGVKLNTGITIIYSFIHFFRDTLWSSGCDTWLPCVSLHV